MIPHTAEKNAFPALAPLLVLLVTCAVFLPSLDNGFLNWDDAAALLQNPHYRGLGLEQLKWMFTTGYGGPYQPLSWLTLGADYLLWGLDPFGYHFTNVLLHGLNALAFYFLCLRLLVLAGREAPAPAAELSLAAGFAALFFSVHPLRVESVSWVTERRDVLCGLFYVLALNFYLAARGPGGEKYSFRRRHLLPLAAFLLALLSKGMAVTLPLALLLLDIYPLRRLPVAAGRWRSPESRPVWLEKLPYFFLAAVFGTIGYICQAQAGALAYGQGTGLAPRAAQSLFAAAFYIRKTLLPLGLSPLYRLPEGFGLLSLAALLSGAALALLTAGTFSLRRRWPAVPAAWAFYLAALSPVSGLVRFGVQAAADRYTYLPCLGFAALAGAALLAARRALPRRGRFCAAGALLILVGLAGLTWRQQGVWRNSETLWAHALALDPGLDYAQNNLGLVLAERGDTDAAEKKYRAALLQNPRNAEAHYNLGRVMDAQGRTAEAEKSYRAALQVTPGYARAHNNLGAVLAAQGRPDAAVEQYREALRLNPELAEAHYNLGLILEARSETAGAEQEYRAALRLSPGYAAAHNNLGVVLDARGRTAEAERHYRAALELMPDSAETHSNLGLVLAAQGKLEDAAGHYGAALRLNPGFAAAHYNLALVLDRQGKAEEAAGHYREAARLNPAMAAPARR
ncbi:MAG TPA: tetratricopeptide repeat protein [Elusimicrobiales bacterium]|nr:tetratricopeptide repeat protein [Elusimicrobiales bacterium]